MDLLAQLDAILKPRRTTRRGERLADCPWCGKPAKRGQTHFHYSTAGAHCFVCGEGASLAGLARFLDVHDPAPAPIYTPEPSRFTTRQYTADAHPARYQMWHRYKKVPPEIVDKYRLGYGREYGRDWLQIPIYRCIDSDGNELPKFDKHALQCIGVRLRSVPPAKKWMSMRDTPAGDLLYPHPQIVGEGDVLWIAENMIDALLLMKMWPGTPALALCAGAGPGKWHHEFSTQIARRRPSGVVLALDNDDPGRAMTAEAVESLALAGIPAMPYGWGEQGAEEGDDVGSFLLTRAAGV
jgi:hypothetical protein